MPTFIILHYVRIPHPSLWGILTIFVYEVLILGLDSSGTKIPIQAFKMVIKAIL